MARNIDDLARDVAELSSQERVELLRLVGPLLSPEELERQARIQKQRSALARTSGMMAEIPPGPHSTTVDEVLYGPKLPRRGDAGPA